MDWLSYWGRGREGVGKISEILETPETRLELRDMGKYGEIWGFVQYIII
jgi:hypothetical protein